MGEQRQHTHGHTHTSASTGGMQHADSSQPTVVRVRAQARGITRLFFLSFFRCTLHDSTTWTHATLFSFSLRTQHILTNSKRSTQAIMITCRDQSIARASNYSWLARAEDLDS